MPRDIRSPSANPGEVGIRSGAILLHGDLQLPRNARGLVIFAHGSGSSRHSPRNRQVATALRDAGLATLLMDLLTGIEESLDERTRELRFDVHMLAERVVVAVDWAMAGAATGDLPIGLFGASTGAAAALLAAVARPAAVRAVVARGGRPDLASDGLAAVRAPTRLIVGELDDLVIDLNREAMAQIPGVTDLQIVPGAGHLFEEPGRMAIVSSLAAEWFNRYLVREEQRS